MNQQNNEEHNNIIEIMADTAFARKDRCSKHASKLFRAGFQSCEKGKTLLTNNHSQEDKKNSEKQPIATSKKVFPQILNQKFCF